jgi:O-antigen ligase
MSLSDRISQILILIVIAMTATWLRLPFSLPFLPELYVSQFAILIPILTLVVWWLVTGSVRHLLRFDIGLWACLVTVFLGWVALSQTWALMSTFPSESVNYRPEVAQTAAWQWLWVALFASVVASTRPMPGAITSALAVSIVPLVLIVVLQAIRQQSIGLILLGEFQYNITQRGISVLTAGDLLWVRPYGLLPHPNHTGGYLAVATLACTALVLMDRRWLCWVGTVLFWFGLYGLLLTFSRSAWIGFAAGGVFTLVYGGRWLRDQQVLRRQVFIALAGAVVVTLIFTMQYRPLVLARTIGPFLQSERTQETVDAGEIESIESMSLESRAVLDGIAWRSIREHPMRGVGIGNAPWQASIYLMDTDLDLRANYGHNTFLAAWSDVGLVGLLLYLTVLAVGVFLALRQQRSPAQGALLAGWVALAVAGVFDYYTWALLPFQLLWIGLLAAALANHPSRQSL